MKRSLSILLFLVIFVISGEAQNNETKRILIFGDSITAGYGVGEQEAFPAHIQSKIDSLGWNFNVINGGLSGETSAGGLRRIDWMLRQDVDVFVLELGGNDGLRGIDLESTRKNLQGIIDKVRNKHPDAEILLAAMQVPPNLGPDYTKRFKDLYPELADANDATLIPFILEGVAATDSLMQSDQIHPNARGHRKVAENIWQTLKPVLRDLR